MRAPSAARPAPGGTSPAEPTPKTVFGRIVILAIGVRLVLEAIGLGSVASVGGSPWGRALRLWSSWDAPHYLRIAEIGYRSGTPPPDDPLFIVFFPFFPLAVRAVSVLARDLILSGLLVSMAASVGGAWFLYRLVRLDAPHDDAWRAVLLLFAFPTAYYLAAPYSEALFLFAVLASVYAARTGRWRRAGLAGALATGTRVAGIALVPALLVEARQNAGGRAELGRRLAWVGAAGAGLAVYLGINWTVHGDPLWFLAIQRSHWFQHAIPPWQSIIDAARGLLTGTGNSTRSFILWGRLSGFVFALPFLVIGIRRLRVADAVYGWVAFVLVLSTSWLISLPRYLLAVYPIFIVGACLTRSPVVLRPVLAVSAAAQAFFFWRYASGAWTF